ncbi:hypothetical protein ABPG77_000024 [Micractinium sp. CCAP 211/92]
MATVAKEEVLALLQQLSHDIRDLDVGSSVDRHQKLPVVQFLRDYVAANKPVVLTGVVSHWPAYANWNDEYLCQVAGDTEVTVALTPNGRADAVTPLPSSCGAGLGSASSEATSPGSGSPTAAAAEAAVSGLAGSCSENGGGRAAARGNGAGTAGHEECFALPHQVKMPLRDFLALLRSSRQNPSGSNDSTAELAGGGRVVPYLQYQNSSLTAEVPQLLGDIDLLLSWATQAFGGLPEAVNLWIGDERSVTSWHSDPFENIYAVVAGSKTFTLMPPAELYRMRLRQYSQASMQRLCRRHPAILANIARVRLARATYKPVGGSAPAGSREAVEAVASGAAALAPALHDPPERVLWSSVLPTPDMRQQQQQQQCRAAVEGGLHQPGKAPAAAPARDLFADPSLPPPLVVTVKAGEALYLPAKWWHQVEQEPDASGRAIAVNYWYDMKFDVKAAYLQAVERLAELLGLNEPPPPPPTPRLREAAGADAQLRPPYTGTRALG